MSATARSLLIFLAFKQPPHFAGYDDLIALKQAAGREQDLLDIAELERARGAS